MANVRTATAYQYVADTLRRRILHGEFGPGERLPTERELCELFSASRITIRRSLDILADELLIERRQGDGTFVSPTPSRRIPLLSTDVSGSISRMLRTWNVRLSRTVGNGHPATLPRRCKLGKARDCYSLGDSICFAVSQWHTTKSSSRNRLPIVSTKTTLANCDFLNVGSKCNKSASRTSRRASRRWPRPPSRCNSWA